MSKRRPRFYAMLRRTLRTLVQGENAPTAAFSPEMTIDQAWHAHPDAPRIFAQYNLPACDGCAVRFDERLGEACEAYGIDLNLFLRDLNSILM